MTRKMRSDSKRDEILGAAIRLFARQGFDGTAVKEIAAEAGVTDAALYKHFASKEALAFAVYSHYSALYTRLIDSAATHPGPFRERLERLVTDVVHLYQQDPFGLQLLGDRYLFYHQLPPGQRLPSDAIREFITAGVQSGEIPPQEPLLTGVLFFGAMIRVTVWCDIGLLGDGLDHRLGELQQRVRGLFGLP